MTERATQPHRGRLTALGPAVWLRRENHMVWRVGDRYLAGFNWELRFVWLVSGYLLGSLSVVCVLFSRYDHELRPSSVPFPIIYTCLHPLRSVHHCYYYSSTTTAPLPPYYDPLCSSAQLANHGSSCASFPGYQPACLAFPLCLYLSLVARCTDTHSGTAHWGLASS